MWKNEEYNELYSGRGSNYEGSTWAHRRSNLENKIRCTNHFHHCYVSIVFISIL